MLQRILNTVTNPANYFDRQAFLQFLPPPLVETLYNMWLRSGGTSAATSNLVDINTQITELESDVATAASGGTDRVDADTARRAISLLRASQEELGHVYVQLDKLRREVNQIKAMQ
jgi:hypothetical protein